MKRNGGWKGDEGVKARAKELNYHFSYARRCVNPTIHVHVPAKDMRDKTCRFTVRLCA